MEDFKNYLDKVRADEELKEKTQVFVRNNYPNEILHHSRLESGKGELAMKKLIVALVSAAACLMILIGGYAYYNTPVNYVSLDINPSVELGVNSFNRVVSAEGINADGEALLVQNRVRNMSVENALQELVQEAAEQGYVAEDGSTVIALTVLAEEEDKGIQLCDKTRDRVQLLLREKDMDAIVYTDCSNLQIRTQAQELGISPGKFKLITMLQAMDPAITVEQYRNARITEIICKADELLQSSATAGVQSQEYERTRAMIMAAGQAISQNQLMLQEKNMIQNQYQNKVQDQTGAGQIQNQVQSQYQNQSQDQNNQGQQNQTQNQIQNQTQNQTQDQTQSQIQTQTQSSEEPQQNQGGNKSPDSTGQEQEQEQVKQGKN